jgi:hypothetical protein
MSVYNPGSVMLTEGLEFAILAALSGGYKQLEGRQIMGQVAELAGIKLQNWNSVTSSINLPREIGDISAEFLTEALRRRFPGIAVKDFKIPFVHHGFTTILRLDLDLDEAGKNSGLSSRIILKGGFEPQTRGIAGEWAIGPFLMEVGAYRTLPGLGLNMPDCYFAEVDMDETKGPQIILLMEDLAERGAKFGHGLVPHTVEQVRNRLTAIAAFHAKTWNSPELAEGGRYSIFPRNANALFKGYLEHVGPPELWKKFCELPRGAACSVEFHDLDWVHRAMDFMIELGDSTPNCLVHGDLHAGNLFEEPDGKPGFYDSLPMRTAPMIEISYHIANVLNHSDRRRHDRELVQHYRNELIRNEVTPPGLDELMYQFAAFLPYGYATFIVNSNTYQTESFNTAHAARYNVAMLDHGTRDMIA